MATHHTPKRPVKSITTTFAIIESISEKGPSGVVELANEIGLSQSTVHSHLSTLVSMGYLIQEDDKYWLGLRFLEHGGSARQGLDFYDAARKELDELCERIDAAIWLHAEEYGRGVIIDHLNRADMVGTREGRVGWRFYLHSTAGGKAILANFSKEDVDAIVDEYGLPRFTDQTITTRDALYSELETIREQGYAINDEETSEGIYSIGAPILYDGEVRGAVSVSDAAHRMRKTSVREEILDALLDTTNQIELRLKYG